MKKKNVMQVLIGCLLSVSFVISSCSQEDPRSWENQPGDTILSLGVQGIQTRTGDDAFTTLDRIGLYVTSYSNGSSQPLLSSGNYADNVGFTLIEETDTWQADDPVYYPADGSPIDLYAYYPYTDPVFTEGTTLIPFSIQTDQSDYARYTASDLAIASTFAVQRSTNKVTLTFDHKLSQLVFALKAGTGFTATDLQAAKIIIKNAITHATFDLSAGNPGLPTAGTERSDVTPNGEWEVSETDPTLLWGQKAIIVPQELNTTTYLEIKIGTRTFTKRFDQPIAMQSGESRTFTITLNNNSNTEIDLSVILNPWNYGEPVEGEATEEEDECTGGILTDLEGNTYTYRKFGDAGYWMTQNLRVTKYADGTVLRENGDIPYDDYTTASYYYPRKETSILSTHPEYGLLYTWAGATKSRQVTINESNSSTQVQVQGICPDGWHLPSDYEWNELEKEIVNNYIEYSTGLSEVEPWNPSWETTQGTRGSHGQVMKSTTPITTYETEGYSKPASSCNGGFDALLVGYIYSGLTTYYGRRAFFWSSSAINSAHSWSRQLITSSATVDKQGSYRSHSYSVRCKKDE